MHRKKRKKQVLKYHLGPDKKTYYRLSVTIDLHSKDYYYTFLQSRSTEKLITTRHMKAISKNSNGDP